MFVPHARVRLVGLPEHARRKRRRVARRRLKCAEILRMPCLLPTFGAIFLGIVVLASGCMMSIMGFYPGTISDTFLAQNNTQAVPIEYNATYYTLKCLSYLGPMLMGIGLFVIIVAAVLYCEIMDKYVNIVPDQNSRKIGKDELYKMIMEQFRKNYFRGIEVPLQKPHSVLRSSSVNKTLFKALSISTPAMLVTPELTSPWKKRHKSPLPDRKVKKSVKLKLMEWEERWLKTSSLPNIRPVEIDSTDAELSSDTGIACREECLKIKRMSRSCGNVPEVCDVSVGEFSEMTSSGLDNPAYIADPEKEKLLKPKTLQLSENYRSCDHIQNDNVNIKRVSVIVHKASIHTPPDLHTDLGKMYVKGIRAIKSCDQESFEENKLLDNVRQTGKYKSCLGLVNGEKFRSHNSINDNLKPVQVKDANSTESITLTEDMLRIFDMAEMARV
ncbi:hypothetical protein SNE40_004596 [Patella caerulea]|uniref:Uncharacterized protein n=1 Tax=Patella caerulea TaxID=87958 RepID=A0AAN8K5W6_PATCE